MTPKFAAVPNLLFNLMNSHAWIVLVALLFLLSCGFERSGCASDTVGKIEYARDIQPILTANCIKCHGAQEAYGDLRLDSAAGILRGGSHGPAVIANDPHNSTLLQAVSRMGKVEPMPPEGEGPSLQEEQVSLIQQWIEQGADLPANSASENFTDRIKSEHWAFQPIRCYEVPQVSEETLSPTNPIDAFVLSEIERREISPSSPAEKSVLIRRVSLDLTGLPPSQDDVEEFIQDSSPDAYERFVDKLLDSPHYGERWARWWLDQARYADSDGYTNDFPRVIWKYRDYVIKAFNDDLPFDRFIVEQLAGDLLPNAEVREKVATGFHRNTQTYSEGDSATEEYRVENIVDRVHTTGVVLLGLTLGCARCHNHKFDPITQREFFELYAFFNNQDETSIEVGLEEWQDGSSLDSNAKTTSLVFEERSVPRETRVHVRGDYLTPGRQVMPNTPEILPPLAEHDRIPTRLDLANWIVSSENPLTSRVIANRFWQAFFGTGIVETDDDFGSQGATPTNPRLLDWLALRFQESGWGVKALHRLIVTSQIYRQSSNDRPDLIDADPRNYLFARQNRLRLDAELVRDGALASSGLLSRKIGGPSVFPPQPEGAMQMTQHMHREWVVSIGEDRYRRGLYTFIWRLAPYPMFNAFNAPSGSVTCTRRVRANTPLQVLTLLNDEVFVEGAQALAGRVLNDMPNSDDKSRLIHAFQLCLIRAPGQKELAVLQELLATERKQETPGQAKWYPVAALPIQRVGVQEFAAWTAVARTLLNLDEFITRE